MDLWTQSSEGAIRTFDLFGSLSKGVYKDELDQHQQGQGGESVDEILPTFDVGILEGTGVIAVQGLRPQGVQVPGPLRSVRWKFPGRCPIRQAPLIPNRWSHPLLASPG